MTINGANGVNANIPAGQMGMSQADDPVSKEIQRKITNAQKQLQELSANTELSMEEKSKRRQEIQKEISELNNQLRQHQIEMRREKQLKKEEESSFDDMLGGNQKANAAKSNTQTAGLSQASMESMISADTSMKQARVQGSVATEMEGKAGVLQEEIKLDSARGQNTERKQAQLADVEKKASQAIASQISTLAEANKVMADAAKADRTTDKTEDYETSKTDKVDETDGNKQTESGNNQSRSDEADSENASADSQSVVYYTPVDVRL